MARTFLNKCGYNEITQCTTYFAVDSCVKNGDVLGEGEVVPLCTMKVY
jgi:hypothetical protein